MSQMLRTIILALLATCLWARFAHAGYDARATELREILKKKELRDEKEREILAKALDEYLKDRQECLESLVRIIEEANPDSKEEDRWLTRIDLCRAEVGELGNAMKSIPDTPSVGAFNFVGVTQVEEINFFTNLTKTKVGERRDRITMNRRNVAEKMKELREKWRFVSDEDNRIDDAQNRIREQLTTMIDKGFEEADRHRRTVKERLLANTQTVRTILQAGTPIRDILKNSQHPKLQALMAALDGIENASEVIDEYAKVYLKWNIDYHARAGEYLALMKSEIGGIYVLFAEFRRSTEDFLKTNGFDKAKIDYQAASDTLSSWASSNSTSGQKSDAEAFAKAVLGKLSNHLSMTETAFNQFVNEHQEKFFGPIMPSIVESLAETRVWEDWSKVIQGRGLDSKVRVWRNEANNFFDVSLANLASVDQEYLMGLIRGRTAELVRALDEAAKLPDKFKTDFDRRKNRDEIK